MDPITRQTQGKIERWRQTLTNTRWGFDPPDQILVLRTLLENDNPEGDLQAAITSFA